MKIQNALKKISKPPSERSIEEQRDLNNNLIEAASEGNAETVNLLLDRGADINAGDDRALTKAARKGQTEVVILLLDRGADIHADDDMALRVAANNGHTETVNLLLNRGADIHAADDWALRWAANNDYTETASLMLVHYNMKVKPETREFLKEHALDTFKILEKRDLNEKLEATLKPKLPQQERVIKI